MTQRLSHNQQIFLDRITDALNRGGRLTEATLNYIDAALFSPEPERLAAFLQDDADSERDTLLDLIFYPDQSLQIALEPLLEKARFGADEVRDLGDALVDRPIDAPIRMPDGRQLIHIQVPDFVKHRYLDRLNVTWQLDPHLAAAIDGHVSALRQPLLKVRLRNAGLCHTSGQLTFLGRFVERMADDDPDYSDCLDLVLAILPKSDLRTDPCSLLVEHKRVCFRSLQQARRFEVLLRRSNMETLMLQGVRAPQTSADDLMRRMRLIDLVCRHVFGMAEGIDTPMDAPEQQIADLDDPEAVFRSLLG